MGNDMSISNISENNQADTLNWNDLTETEDIGNNSLFSDNIMNNVIQKIKNNNLTDNNVTSVDALSQLQNNNLSETSLDNATSVNAMSQLQNNHLSETSLDNATSVNAISQLQNNNLSETSMNNSTSMNATSEITKSQINNLIISDTSDNFIKNFKGGKRRSMDDMIDGSLFSSDSDSDNDSDSYNNTLDFTMSLGTINENKSNSHNSGDMYNFEKSTSEFNSSVQSKFSGYSLGGLEDTEEFTYSLSGIEVGTDSDNNDTEVLNFESNSESEPFNTSDIDVVSINSGKRFL